MAYVRTVKTSSGALAVQVVWSSRRGSREVEHLGSAHDEAELEALKAAAQQRIAAVQAHRPNEAAMMQPERVWHRKEMARSQRALAPPPCAEQTSVCARFKFESSGVD